MKKVIFLALAGLVMLAACNKSETVTPSVPMKSKLGANTLSSTNGSAGVELIYYDGQKFMMNLNPFSDNAGSNLLMHNKSINNLYEAEGFLTVTDAIQGDGYNPVWQEVDITFVTIAPKQFLRDDDVLAAAAAAAGQITLTPTGEMYRCDIIQKSKPQ